MLGQLHHFQANRASTAERIGYTGTRVDLNISQLQADKASTGFNPIVELAKETGTPLHRWKESTLLVDDKGHLVSPSEANKALGKVWEILEAAIEHSTNSNKEINSSASLYSFFQGWCERASQCGDMTGREAKLVLGMSQMWGAYVGDRVELQSLKYFYLEDCIAGGRPKDWLLVVYG